jgi:hypothetical protein
LLPPHGLYGETVAGAFTHDDRVAVRSACPFLPELHERRAAVAALGDPGPSRRDARQRDQSAAGGERETVRRVAPILAAINTGVGT